MRLIRFFWVSLFSLWAGALYASNMLVINTTGQPPLNTAQGSGFMDRVAAEALAKIGYRLQTIRLPAERGLRNSNAGIDDGEMSRIAGLEKLYPNLIRVPEKIMDWEFNAFANREIRMDGAWSALSPYVVAYINGWKILEKNVPVAAQITKVKNPEQLFSILQKDRADVIIYERWGGLQMIQQQHLNNTLILTPPLATKEMFIYLHKKHKHLVPRLARALSEMKQSGAYQKIYDETLGPLAKKNKTGEQSLN